MISELGLGIGEFTSIYINGKGKNYNSDSKILFLQGDNHNKIHFATSLLVFMFPWICPKKGETQWNLTL